MSDKTESTEGIRIDMVKQKRLSEMATTEKINYIIDAVQDGCIVILETGLPPEEQSLLVEKTMNKIDHNEFKGIEIETYPSQEKSDNGLISRTIRKTVGKDNKNSPEYDSH